MKNPPSVAPGLTTLSTPGTLAPALHYYRGYHIYIAEKRGERITDTVVWFPTKGQTPMSSSTDLAIADARGLIAALRSPQPDSPISPLSESKVSALKVMAETFKSTSLRIQCYSDGAAGLHDTGA